MCLVAVAIGQSRRFPWVIISNRDEFFDRPAAPLAWWLPAGASVPILSGRDLAAGGTWLGLNARGHLALLTNVREPGRFLPGTPSRGELVPQWLQGAPGSRDARALLQVPRNGFNLLAADLHGALEPSQGAAKTQAAPALWLSNRAAPEQPLSLGLHGVSNAALNTPWPKLVRLKQRLGDALAAHRETRDTAGLMQPLFEALASRTVAADADLPQTGVPLERERQLSPAFIRIPAASPEVSAYGTRCSTVVVVEQTGSRRVVHVVERSFDLAGAVANEAEQRFDLG